MAEQQLPQNKSGYNRGETEYCGKQQTINKLPLH
jgi:hypothetical protein